MTLHESFTREEQPERSSNRAFGLVFAIVFALLTAYLFRGESEWWTATLAVSAVFAIASFAFPRALSPLNRAWTAFGLLIAKVTTPVILALIFVSCFLPIAILARIRGKDFLRLGRKSGTNSYWVTRDGESKTQTDMKNQF